MSSFLDKLNLRPGERRLVVVVSLIVFAVLYLMFVWPQFKEWGRLKHQKVDFETSIQRFQKEINLVPAYQKQLAELKKKGVQVADEKQALEMQRRVTSLAAMHNVQLNSYSPSRHSASSSGGKTNQFFEEQSGTINVLADEDNLVQFLYALSSGDSLIRVRSMTLNPDAPHMKLMANITLVASYPRVAGSPTPAAVPGSPTPPARSAVRAPARPARTAPAAPKSSVSAAVTARAQAKTNATAKVSWWTKVKNFFTGSSSEPKKAAAVPSHTNAPPARRPAAPVQKK